MHAGRRDELHAILERVEVEAQGVGKGGDDGTFAASGLRKGCLVLLLVDCRTDATPLLGKRTNTESRSVVHAAR